MEPNLLDALVVGSRRAAGMLAESLSPRNATMPADTVSVIIIERSNRLSHERLHQRVSSSLPQLARFRSRLVDKPLGLGKATWAEIDDYDPAHQIHSATLEAPGRARELGALVSQLSAGPPDRWKPLWETWSIDGLAGGRWALAVRMSPALSDGASSILPRLLDTDPSHVLPTEPTLGPPPSLGEFVIDAMTEFVEKQFTGVGLIWEAAARVLQTLGRRGSGPDPPVMLPAVMSMSGPVPHNAYRPPLTPRRAVAFTSIPLAQLRTVSKAFGGSIVNVFLAACTLSLRGWLQRHDTVPDDPLLMQMPLAHSPADTTTLDDTCTVGRIRIPVQLDDPVQVLINLHTATERLNKQRTAERATPTVDFASLVSLIPTPIAREGVRLCTRLGLVERLELACHGNVSYLSGMPARAYCAGNEVVGMHTVAPLTDGGLNITLTSRGGMVDVTVSACPDNVPAVDEIASGIALSVGTLVAAAQESPRGQGRSVVTEMTSHTKGGRIRHSS